MNIAVLPARGGSQRIPRKNVRPFCGKPIIAWPIETAISSGLFDRVIVSTDDAEIRSVAERHGAECPFERPAALADDHATTSDVMAHAVAWVAEAGLSADAICCIYPTAVFAEPGDLRNGLDALSSGAWAFAVAATEFEAPIFRSFRQREDGGLEMFFPEHFATRSQDLPQALHDTGQFYWGRPSAWLAKQRIFDRSSVPVLIPKSRVQDIDDADDWARAEAMFNHLRASRT
jgi:pseudaminic acid cytidylyltransferase